MPSFYRVTSRVKLNLNSETFTPCVNVESFFFLEETQASGKVLTVIIGNPLILTVEILAVRREIYVQSPHFAHTDI